jgi:hypothetical protein
VVAQRNQVSARRQDGAASLVAEAFSAVRTIVSGNSIVTNSGYGRIYCPPSGECASETIPATGGKASADHYYPVLVGTRWELDTGDQLITHNDIEYTRYVTIENVCRLNGDISDSYAQGQSCASGTDDPYTQKITVTMQAPAMADLVTSLYVTRAGGATAASQTDWGGGVAADTDPTGESVVEFSIDWSDLDGGERVRALVCKSNEIDAGTYSCPGSSWVESPGWTTDDPIVLYYTPTDFDAVACDDDANMTTGDCGYDIYVCDDGGACSAAGSGTFTAAP